ncbi:MAG: hypothetical protein ACREQ9_14405, partial [Candidatus Binatia bacterium]
MSGRSVEHRDPHSLIRDTAAAVRRRERTNVLLPCVPPALSVAALGFLGALPPEALAAALIVGALALLHAASPPPA